MCPDPCLSIFISQELLQDPCLRINVSASLSSDSVALRRRNANFDLRRRVLCGPAQGKQSGRDPRERFAQAKRKFWPLETRFVWPCAGKTVRPRVSRRRNAKFDLPSRFFCDPAQAKRKFHLPRRVLCPYHVDSRGVTTTWTKIATALQRDAQKFTQPTFRASETQILTSGVAFFAALRSEKRADRKFAPRPKRLYPYRKNPSVCHTVWGMKQVDLGMLPFEYCQFAMKLLQYVMEKRWILNHHITHTFLFVISSHHQAMEHQQVTPPKIFYRFCIYK